MRMEVEAVWWRTLRAAAGSPDMRSRYVRHTSVLSIVLAAALASACSGRSPRASTGTARVWVHPLTAGDEIARVVVRVSKGLAQGASDFTPIVAELTSSLGAWTGRITSIPAGAARQFDVVAYDAAGVQLYTGSGAATIVAGSAAVISIYLRGPLPPPFQNNLPVIDSVSWSRDQIAPGGTVELIVSAHDPDAGQTLSYLWTAKAGAFDDPTRTTAQWTAPAAEGRVELAISVRDDHGGETIVPFAIVVTSNVGDADVTVAMNAWPNISGLSASVTLGTTFEGDLSVDAVDADGDPLAYDWTSTCAGITISTQAPYSVTKPHVSLPPPAAPCSVTVAVSDGKSPGGPQATVILSPAPIGSLCRGVSCPTGQHCDAVDGACKPDSICVATCPANTCGPDGCGGACRCAGTDVCDTTTFQCTAFCSPSCAPNTCGPDGCGGTCSCSGTDVCNPATLQCSPACTPTCPPNTCGSNGCGGTCSCSGGDVCDTTTFQCGLATSGPTVTPVAARDLQLSPPAALAMDASGNTFVAGNLFGNTPVNFQSSPVGPPLMLQSSGGIDIFLGRYDPSGNIAWGVTIGDDDTTVTNDQTATGVAVTSSGVVAAIGRVVGAVTFGTSTLLGAGTPAAYVAAVSATNGTRLWGKSFGLGQNGLFRSVSANPSSSANRIAVCGSTSSAAAALVGAGTTYAGGASDIVVAVFDSSGSKLWATQIGGAGLDVCSAVAVDDSGDVYATGQFDSAAITFPGATPITLTGPGTSTRKFMWVAKFAGAGNGGAASTLAATAFSGTAGNATPQTIAAGPGGEVVVAGNFSANLTIGAAMTSAGADDAFVARLAASGPSFAPAWNAVRFGGTGTDLVKSVALAANGDVVAIGTVNPATAAFRTANGGFDTTGAVQLSVNGTGAADLFVVRLDGQSGASQFASTYGDSITQNGDAIVLNRFSSASQLAFTGMVSGSATFGTAGTVTAVNASDAAVVFGSSK
jgi:hypothetical protein